jgi:hypothetical protein
MLANGKSFTGTAAELLDVLAEYDPDFSADTTGPRGNRLWSAKRLGKRLAMLWQYVVEVADCRQDKDTAGHATVFSIKPKAVLRFETLKQQNPPREDCIGTLPISAKETAIPQSDAADLLPDETEMSAYLEGLSQ